MDARLLQPTTHPLIDQLHDTCTVRTLPIFTTQRSATLTIQPGQDQVGLVADSHIDVMAKDAGAWVAASGKVYKNGFFGNQHFTAAAVAEQKALSLSRANLFGKIGKGTLIASYLFTGYSIASEGYKPHHGADLAVTTILALTSTFLPGVGLVLAAGYLLADLITIYATGESITEKLFDKK